MDEIWDNLGNKWGIQDKEKCQVVKFVFKVKDLDANEPIKMSIGLSSFMF